MIRSGIISVVGVNDDRESTELGPKTGLISVA